MIILTGDNEYLIKRRLSELVNDFKKKNGDFSIERIDSKRADFNSVISNLQSISFLSSNRMFILDRPGNYDIWTSDMNDLISTIPSSTTVVILEPKIDKRLKYYKDLKQIDGFEVYDILNGSQLTNWIINYVKKQAANIDFSDANYLISIVGNDQNRLVNELDKLLAYDLKISKKNIDLLVEPSLNTTAFKLLDVSFSGQHQQVTKIFNQLIIEKTEIPQIIGAIAWQLQLFAIIKSSPGLTSNQVAEKAGVNVYTVENSMRTISNHSYSDIASYAQKLVDLDVEFSDYQIDRNEALINLLNSFYK
ncbi:MAG TPA: DNA polymerase III subunit delta [Candidatus Dormibacteraeota bacterium]|nr:DNA polymerase III subunit delta [Candidatus Dormibacteraeota bacterium]